MKYDVSRRIFIETHYQVEKMTSRPEGFFFFLSCLDVSFYQIIFYLFGDDHVTFIFSLLKVSHIDLFSNVKLFGIP